MRSSAFKNCKAEGNAAKERLAKKDKDQNLITQLGKEADGQSYVMLEAGVIMLRKD